MASAVAFTSTFIFTVRTRVAEIIVCLTFLSVLGRVAVLSMLVAFVCAVTASFDPLQRVVTNENADFLCTLSLL